MVEALGIEERWREVGFGGSRGVSFAKSEKTSESRNESIGVRSVSLGLVGSDCSNEVSRISEAIAALDTGDVAPARALLGVLFELLSSKVGVALPDVDGLRPPADGGQGI
jgi:hypothetical protein